jgi:NAD(P)-dependent dehydrogenase (short-subunit alcohol dehydrogenase family)
MNSLFNISGKVAVVTGAGGVLGGSIARSLAEAGVKVVATGRNLERLEAKVEELRAAGGEAMAIACDILSLENLKDLAAKVVKEWGRIDILLNIAGGNMPGATVNPDRHFYDMEPEAWEEVISLNLNGTLYPTMVIGKEKAEQKSGVIINVSSMAAFAALTRVPGYSAAKAGVSNLTRWLATEMAQKYGDRVRVNAIAPGFFIGNQNRALLINPDGSLTERSRKILGKTPMGRFGDISEVNGAVQFLCSDAASFITGVVLPIDGGFEAYSGV